MTSAKTIVTVMLGGGSAEREVSLRSGQAVARALRGLGYTIHEVDPQNGAWALPTGTAVVFLALHGTQGEDGAMQARLESMGMPYTGCGPEASRVAFDKAVAKRAMEVAGVPTPSWFRVEALGTPWPEGVEPPLVVKPSRQGSSVGLSIVRDRHEWEQAVVNALRHDASALAERWIDGRELTVGLLGGEALPIVEVRPRKGWYDYRNKYTPGATEYACPASLSESLTRQVQVLALRAFEAVGGRDYARIDVMLDREEHPWVLEINTLPGMTETSLLPMAAAAAGISFETLCETMIALALKRSRSV